MKERQQNISVALFVLCGLAVTGWLVFRFGDLPALVTAYDSHEVVVHFDQAPGVQQNTDVLFCGYRVGKVTAIKPPQLLPDPCDPQRQFYQVVVTMAIDGDYDVPANVLPRIQRRGFSGGVIVLELPAGPPADTMLAADQPPLVGTISQGSEFIPEETQAKLDNLMDSLTSLSETLQAQLTPVLPDEVDSGQAPHANVTTAIMRMDEALRNVNEFVGDEENQANFKRGLAELAEMSAEVREALAETKELSNKASTLIERISHAVDRMETIATNANESFGGMAEEIQLAAEQLSVTLQTVQVVFQKISAGEGTAGRIVNDPRLYESLADTMENLNTLVQDLQVLVDTMKEKGVKLTL